MIYRDWSPPWGMRPCTSLLHDCWVAPGSLRSARRRRRPYREPSRGSPYMRRNPSARRRASHEGWAPEVASPGSSLSIPQDVDSPSRSAWKAPPHFASISIIPRRTPSPLSPVSQVAPKVVRWRMPPRLQRRSPPKAQARDSSRSSSWSWRVSPPPFLIPHLGRQTRVCPPSAHSRSVPLLHSGKGLARRTRAIHG